MRVDETAPSTFPEGVEDVFRNATEDPFAKMQELIIEAFLCTRPWAMAQEAIVRQEAQKIDVELPIQINSATVEAWSRRWMGALSARVEARLGR